MWHFDHYVDAENLGVKKPRWVVTAHENYTMSATAQFDEDTGLVQGSFPVSWYLKQGKDLVHRYDLFPPVEGTAMMSLLEVTPLD